MEKKVTQRRQGAHSAPYQLRDGVLVLEQDFVLATVDRMLPALLKDVQRYSGSYLRIDLSRMEKLDSAGVAALRMLERKLAQQGVETEIAGGSEVVQKVLGTFSIETQQRDRSGRRPFFLELIGARAHRFFADVVGSFFYLVSDVFYWSIADLFRGKTFRRGEFVNQAVGMGVRAVGIVVAMAFLIGLVLALQSAAQLRQFGANRFMVDLIVVAMMREMGPLVTAIIVAGRSGSSIASEIATMKVTEELDALKTMALDPIRFVVVPKMYAAVFTMPFLTILACILGITGGMIIAFLYLDITPIVFLNRTQEVLLFRDIVTGIIKSLVFAGLIVLAGSFFGFRARRGAAEVGQAATSAVVASISLVIVADSILGLIFY